MPPRSVQTEPPLLETSTAPSGPTPAPLGPPPSVAITSVLWFQHRDSVWRLISTRITEPSAMAIGPSGKPRPSATMSSFRVSDIASPEGVEAPQQLDEADEGDHRRGGDRG